MVMMKCGYCAFHMICWYVGNKKGFLFIFGNIKGSKYLIQFAFCLLSCCILYNFFFFRMSQTQNKGLKSFWLKNHKNISLHASTLQFSKSWCGFDARSILHYLLCLLLSSGFFNTTKTICQLTHGIAFFLVFMSQW